MLVLYWKKKKEKRIIYWIFNSLTVGILIKILAVHFMFQDYGDRYF